jgi:leucyl-tRNA synthetase
MFSYHRYKNSILSFNQLFSRAAYATKPLLQWPLNSETKLSNSLHEIESYWNDKLANKPIGNVGKDAEKKYILAMFPYPSGMLHMGHMRVYSISDVLNRYYKLNGYNVIHPIGWDAFGLPADNAAKERGIDPKEWTMSNASAMKQQLLNTGVKFDWERELYTCDPKFYKWTQWIFLKLFEQDLVHRTVAEVNWDPVDQTVLAEEQIDGHGCSWRSGAKVQKVKLAQWMIETPKYAKRLSEGLEKLRKNWKEVADIQENWIGKCDVWRFVLKLKDGRNERNFERFDLRIKDPKKLASAQFVIVKRDHALVRELPVLPKETTVLDPTVYNFVTDKHMHIVVLSEELEARDNEKEIEYFLNARLGEDFDAETLELLKLKPKGMSADVTAEQVVELAQKKNCAGYQTSRTLLDWVVSRQRGWGTPIPMALTKKGDAFPVEEQFLPVLTEHRGDEFHSLGKVGKIETDTLDTFFDSSWYYLRFLDPKNENEFADKSILQKYMPVDVYVGGVEHAAVHMFFARFISYFLFDQGLVSCEEPFLDLVPQGIVRGRTFTHPATGRYVDAKEVEQSDENTFVDIQTGELIESSYEKMSKSKHNGIDPLDIIQKDGVDLTRLQLLDAASPRANLDWGTSDLKGLKIWIDRISKCVNTYIEGRKSAASSTASKEELQKDVEAIYRENYNYFVRNTTMVLEVLRVHNTAIARLQGLTNAIKKINPQNAGQSREFERCIHALVIMLQVFAPNTAAELWSALSQVEAIDKQLWNHSKDVYQQSWPKVDADSDIDLIINAFDISCGRVPIKRQELEKLSDKEVMEFAKTQTHSQFFDGLSQKNLNLISYGVSRRNGLHVTIDLKFKEDVNENHLRDILDHLSKARMNAAKTAKHQRKKELKTLSKAA